MYSDASFNNVSNGYNQGVYILYLTDQYSKSCSVSWKFTKLQQVSRSTLAAETLAFTEGTDAAYFISQLGEESKLVSKLPTQINTTDHQSLYDSASTASQIAGKRLRAEMSAIKEMKDKGEIIVHWIGKENQIANSLTRKGASSTNLLTALQHGQLFQTKLKIYQLYTCGRGRI